MKLGQGNIEDPIIALATARGESAIALIRLSGIGVIEIVKPFFSGKDLQKSKSHKLNFGNIFDEDKEIIDECLVAVYHKNNSYTEEESVEISCHGSQYIVQRILELFLRNGVRMAEPGEFTLRAYLNGQLDLSQAEAVADLIASKSRSQHELAMSQLKGGFSNRINQLREELVDFASLLELENDFSEEDVEFANRDKLKNSVVSIKEVVQKLIDSFAYGNAIKEGIPVAIVGPPNAGKSTLLNHLLQEDKAIVSEIAGTTRDVIEDVIQMNGIVFRFIDTAGIRKTDDVIESLGIERTFQQLDKAQIVIYITEIRESHEEIVRELKKLTIRQDQSLLVLLNKIDDFHACHSYDVEEAVSTLINRKPVIAISAETGSHMDRVTEVLTRFVIDRKEVEVNSVVTNARHHIALKNAHKHLDKVNEGVEGNISSDFLALDLKYAMHHLAEITGEVQTDDLLGNIFSKFCIGK